MNQLVKKEIRLIAPAWGVVMVVLLAFPWLGKGDEWIHVLTPAALFFGMIILSVDSFGREFSMGTFLPLLSQPVERRRIWRTKMTVLGTGIGIILVAFIISCTLRFHMVQMGDHFEWHWKSNLSWAEWWECQASYIALVLVACSGALWTTLLIRQVAAAFWVTFLMPVIIVAALSFIVPAKLMTWPWLAWLSYSLPFVYGLAGFWLAHRLFHRAQDVVWSGGVISLSRWRYFERADRVGTVRRRRPLLALFKKEFQLQTISLFFAATLLVLHISLILLRLAGLVRPDSFLDALAEFFWTFWLVLPLVIGGTAVAEERKLGVTAEQFCLPVSRRRQFAVKLFPVLVCGVLLGSLVPLVLELSAMRLGNHSYIRQIFGDSAPGGNDFFNFRGPLVFCFLLVLLSLGLTLAGLYASSLARNFMQALGISVVIIVASIMFYWSVADCSRMAGIELNPVITAILLVLAVPLLLVWLAYGNFKHFQDSRRLWYRNGFGLVGGILLVFALSAVIYNRTWEVFEPAEPAHGPARLSLAHPPILKKQLDCLSVQLPGGQVQLDSFDNPLILADVGGSRIDGWMFYYGLFRLVFSPLPKSICAPQFLPGTNWVSVAPVYPGFFQVFGGHQPGDLAMKSFQTIGIQADGSLWTSERSARAEAYSDRLEPVGTETNWAQVARSATGVWLLKKDGTLWTWSTNFQLLFFLEVKQFPARDNFNPQQVGTDADWRFLSGDNCQSLAGKADGSLWDISRVRQASNELVTVECRRKTNCTGVNFQSYSASFGAPITTVHPDGTLWLPDGKQPEGGLSGVGLKRYGQETNWLSVTACNSSVVAMKTDGTLWSWSWAVGKTLDTSKIFGAPPVRLGIHQDWVAIAGDTGGMVALSADGGLWYWPAPGEWVYAPLPIKLSKQPKYLGNVFDGQ